MLVLVVSCPPPGPVLIFKIFKNTFRITPLFIGMLVARVEYSCVQRKVMFYTGARFFVLYLMKLSDSADLVILVQLLIAYRK